MSSKKQILVLGGNGFIGAEAVEYLLNSNDEYEITLVNRGSWSDWDSLTRIKPRIKANIICDREKEFLADKLDANSFNFDYVIDFSAYKSSAIKNTLKNLPLEKIRLYVLISTDSVYEVSDMENYGNEYFIKESDSKRPESQSERRHLKKFDSYGHHKFK
jgi:UDP-glucose 4-epimerase